MTKGNTKETFPSISTGGHQKDNSEKILKGGKPSAG
jgi:hypothetical protein